MPYFPNKPGVELITDMLNAEADRDFAPTDLQVGPPSTTTLNGRNTVVAIEVVAGILRGAQTTFYYNRLDLAQLVAIRDPQIPDPGFISTRELADFLNAAYGFLLAPEDLEDVLIDAPSYPHVVTLTATAESHVVQGVTTVTLIAGTPPPNFLTANNGSVVTDNNGNPIMLSAP